MRRYKIKIIYGKYIKQIMKCLKNSMSIYLIMPQKNAIKNIHNKNKLMYSPQTQVSRFIIVAHF